MAEDVFGIVGTVIAGAYHVEKPIAEGGFGVVYRAHHAGFRAPVALKCLKIPQQIGEKYQESFLEQFRSEAELLFRLSASLPAVVRPLHVDAVKASDDSFVPFMALEWLEGETLDAIMDKRKLEGRRPLSVKELVRMLTPAARALERAHNFQGPDGPITIVHRDLKPENIFLAQVAGEEMIKILDFGIAKAKSVASQVVGRASQTQEGLSSFTPAYGAPEQWLPKRFGQTGAWTDVWGLALTMVEVMAARPIIDGDHAAMMGTALDQQRRPTPRTEGVQVSDEVEAAFRKALAVDPKERYSDVGEFWDALLEALGLDTEGQRRASGRPRDERAERGAVVREERIEAAVQLGSRVSPAQGQAARAASEVGTLPGDAAGGGVSEASPPGMAGSQSAAAQAIPDLALDAPRPTPQSRRSGMRQSMPTLDGELDLDDDNQSLELALDLEPGERPATRISPPPPSQQPKASSSGPPHGRPSVPEPPVSQAPGSLRAGSPSAPPSVTGVSRVNQQRVSAAPLDPISSSPPASPAPSSSPSSRRGKASGRPAGAAKPQATLVQRFLPGAVLLVLSIVVTLADQAYAAFSGEVFSIGPIRASWLAGAMMVAGVAVVIYKLLPQDR